MTKTAKRSLSAIAAQNRREERAREHAAMLERHAKRREAIAQYERAFTDWCKAEERGDALLGPCPLDPRYHNRDLFPENFTAV